MNAHRAYSSHIWPKYPREAALNPGWANAWPMACKLRDEALGRAGPSLTRNAWMIPPATQSREVAPRIRVKSPCQATIRIK